MTDHEIIRDMLQRAGVVFTECIRATPNHPHLMSCARVGDTEVTVNGLEQDRDHSHGYGFAVEFVFAPDGSLRTLGAWE